MHPLQYLFKFSISLVLLYVFYRAILRPLTFYTWNRFYLLGYSLLCFVIPFVNITPWIEKDGVRDNGLVNFVPVIGNYNGPETEAFTWSSFLQDITLTQWLLILFCLGAATMLIRVLLQYRSLYRIRKKSVLLNTGGAVRLYQTDMPVSPFSFGNAVYFNSSLHSEEELQRIVQHEFVHVKQKHSVDILLGELLCIVNWFNPFAWLIRHAIRQNLEFIADNDVIAKGLDKKEYQYLLLKVVGIPQYSIANNFNFSSLKKRITMMNKMKSAQLHLTRFLFVLPLLVLMLLAFRHQANAQRIKAAAASDDLIPAVDTLPLPPPPPPLNDVAPVHNNPPLPANVNGIEIKSSNNKKSGENSHTATVTLKDGTVEKYNLNNEKEKATFIKKYGVLPAAPPAPSAPPVTALSAINVHLSDKNAPLYVLDGRVQESKGKLNQLTGDDIASINVLKNVDAIAKYGDKAKNGVIEITRKRPLFIVDSVVQEPSDSNKLNPSQIESMNILKGKKATDKYGEKATHGVVEIFTRKTEASAPEPSKPVAFRSAVIMPGTPVGLRPLYVIDGVLQDPDFDLKTINPENINSINVLKDKRATDAYGAKGINGVLLITTKTGTPKANDTVSANVKKPMPESALLIIDGKEMPAGTKAEEVVNPADIEIMHVYSGADAIDRYGDKGKHNVIEITTKKYQADKKDNTSFKADATVRSHFGQFIVNGTITTTDNESIIDGSFSFETKPDHPLLVFDGREIPEILTYSSKPGKYRMLTLSASAGMSKYGDKAKNGVLEITTLRKGVEKKVL